MRDLGVVGRLSTILLNIVYLAPNLLLYPIPHDANKACVNELPGTQTPRVAADGVEGCSLILHSSTDDTSYILRLLDSSVSAVFLDEVIVNQAVSEHS